MAQYKLKEVISKEYELLPENVSKKMFKYLDNNNCERVYEMIKCI